MTIKDILYWARVVFVLIVCTSVMICMFFFITHKEYSEYDPNLIVNVSGKLFYMNQTCEDSFQMFHKPTCTFNLVKVPPAYYLNRFIKKYHVYGSAMGIMLLWLSYLIFKYKREWIPKAKDILNSEEKK